MKTFCLAVLMFCCAATLGCRVDPRIAMLERELRLQEDEIYRLRDRLNDCQAIVPSSDVPAASRGGAPSAESPAADAGPLLDFSGAKQVPGMPSSPAPSGTAASSSESNTAPPWPGSAPKSSAAPLPRAKDRAPLPLVPEPKSDGAKLPVISTPPEVLTAPEASTPPGVLAPPDSSRAPRPDSSRVVRLELNPQLTGGFDADGRPGDEGISVVVLPLDESGQPLDAPADMVVAVHDPAQPAGATLLARWDLPAAETAAAGHDLGPGVGRELDMVWPSAPPAHQELRLFVRYTTSDGRQLEAQRTIRVQLSGKAEADWVPVERAPAGFVPAQPRPVASSTASAAPPAASSPTASSPGRSISVAARPVSPRPVWSPDRR